MDKPCNSHAGWCYAHEQFLDKCATARERERCAKVAEDCPCRTLDDPRCCLTLADKIRETPKQRKDKE